MGTNSRGKGTKLQLLEATDVHQRVVARLEGEIEWRRTKFWKLKEAHDVTVLLLSKAEAEIDRLKVDNHRLAVQSSE